MDDAGLTPAQFRVVCRVARRGVCTESIPNMAAGCRLAIGTIKKSLPFLVSRNVLAKDKRTGRTSIYRVRPPAEWRVEPRPKDTLGQTVTQPIKQTDTKVNSQPHHPDQTATHKGNPSEGYPEKGGSPGSMADWQLEKDEERLRNQIKRIAESSKPDEKLLAAKRDRLKVLREEMKRRGLAGKNAAGGADRNAGTYNADRPPITHERLEEIMANKRKAQGEQPTPPTPPQPVKPKVINIHTDLTAEQRADMGRKLREALKA